MTRWASQLRLILTQTDWEPVALLLGVIAALAGLATIWQGPDTLANPALAYVSQFPQAGLAALLLLAGGGLIAAVLDDRRGPLQTYCAAAIFLGTYFGLTFGLVAASGVTRSALAYAAFMLADVWVIWRRARGR